MRGSRARRGLAWGAQPLALCLVAWCASLLSNGTVFLLLMGPSVLGTFLFDRTSVLADGQVTGSLLLLVVGALLQAAGKCGGMLHNTRWYTVGEQMFLCLTAQVRVLSH